ncbi:MAG: tetratricopeptide repeat protein [Candidatus Obscuribacterales bacterium]|nr:tetratricopeptide repeat protein [Candidatus Obscuribacterales bacterium]
MKRLCRKAFSLLFVLALTTPVALASDAWTAYINAGDHQFQDNKLDDAEKSYQDALTDIEVEGGIKLAYTLNRLATIHRLQHKWQEALEESRSALTIWNQKRGAASLESGRTMTDYAEASLNLGLPADTENYLRQALVIACRPKNTSMLGSQFQGRNQYVNNLINDPSTIPGSPDAARVLNGWVNYYLAGDHYAEAESLQKRSIEMLNQSSGYDNSAIFSPPSEFIPWGGSPDLADAYLKLAEIYCIQSRSDLADPFFTKAIDLLIDKLGESDKRTQEAIAKRLKCR